MAGFPGALPRARTPDPQSAPALRWGLVGTGFIAERFVRSLQRYTNQHVHAVGSRTAESAAKFAAALGLRRGHGSYAELVGDPEVDVVYVATPHPQHYPCALLALRAGKHVLVEKPIALNARQATEITGEARRRGLFCMEAMWTFFLPKYDVIRQLLDDGVLGEVRTVLADHGEHFARDHRIMRPELAGGPLLDLGTYPVALATASLGEPASVIAAGQPASTGVNGQLSAIISDVGGNQALVHCTIFNNTPTSAVIAGSAATLTLPGAFYMPGPFNLTSVDGSRSLSYAEIAVGHEALYFQAAEVARRITSGERESPLRALDDSIATLRIMDEIRRQIGVRFDGE